MTLIFVDVSLRKWISNLKIILNEIFNLGNGIACTVTIEMH